LTATRRRIVDDEWFRHGFFWGSVAVTPISKTTVLSLPTYYNPADRAIHRGISHVVVARDTER